jgi:hypothetical protein
VKAMVEAQTARLTSQYVLYLETFVMDLWSDDGFIEFRAGFTLRNDHILHAMTVRIPATSAVTDIGRQAIIAAVFQQIEAKIDDVIAVNYMAAN